MAVKDGSGPRPAPQPAKRRFLNCLETIASTLAFSCRQLGSEDRAAGLKHHGSEGRIGPAAGTPACQTSLSELPRNYSFNPCFFLPSARVRGPCRRPQTPWQWRTDRARGRHPACQTSLSELPRNYSFNSCFFLPSARVRGSEDRAAGLKHHGSEGRIGPAAGTPACQTSLSELPRNYSFNPCFFLPSARVRGPCRRPQTPWQWRTDRARGRHPSVPNVAFWTA